MSHITTFIPTVDNDGGFIISCRGDIVRFQHVGFEPCPDVEDADICDTGQIDAYIHDYAMGYGHTDDHVAATVWRTIAEHNRRRHIDTSIELRVAQRAILDAEAKTQAKVAVVERDQRNSVKAYCICGHDLETHDGGWCHCTGCNCGRYDRLVHQSPITLDQM
jgi:hypothetical protein